MKLVYLLATLLALGAAYGAPLAPRAEAGANQLLTTQYCEGGRAKVTFSWTGGNTASLEQWLDLSVFDNGWQDGTFIFVGPLVGSLATYTWEGLTPATLHYVRVNQQLGNRSWDPSQTFSIRTISCDGSAAPAPSGAPSVTLLGFSTNYSGGSPPPDLIAPGATRTACNPLNLYAFVQVNGLSERTEFYPTWLTNSTPVPKAPITVVPGTGVFVAVYPPETLSSLPSARYSLRLATSLNGTPVLEGGFTLNC